MTVWVVKGGRGGIREDRFLAHAVIGIGWGEVGDLSDYADREELKAAYRLAFPGRSEGHVNTQVGQLWGFARRMQEGDVVVHPSLRGPEIAIGEIRGPYRWTDAYGPDMPHVREVAWAATEVPRAAFPPELLYSFGGSMTISSVRRKDAERRVQAVAWFAPDAR
jgi:restriction system protein